MTNILLDGYKNTRGQNQPRVKSNASEAIKAIALLCAGLSLLGLAAYMKNKQINETDRAFQQVVANMGGQSHNWTQQLSNERVTVTTGYSYDPILKMSFPDKENRKTHQASIVYTPVNLGSISAYVCEEAGPGRYLLHHIDQKGVFKASNYVTEEQSLQDFCDDSFDIAGIQKSLPAE